MQSTLANKLSLNVSVLKDVDLWALLWTVFPLLGSYRP